MRDVTITLDHATAEEVYQHLLRKFVVRQNEAGAGYREKLLRGLQQKLRDAEDQKVEAVIVAIDGVSLENGP